MIIQVEFKFASVALKIIETFVPLIAARFSLWLNHRISIEPSFRFYMIFIILNSEL